MDSQGSLGLNKSSCRIDKEVKGMIRRRARLGLAVGILLVVALAYVIFVIVDPASHIQQWLLQQ